MKPTSFKFKSTKLTSTLLFFWILTVFASYWGSDILSATVSGLGEIYPFRILLPLTCCLFLLAAFRQKINLWKHSSLLEKLCYLLIVALLVYGAFSLRLAIDFSFSFRRLFNLCFDLAFFFLAIQLCRDARFMRSTVITVGGTTALMCLLGIYEIVFGGIFRNIYDEVRIVPLLYGDFQLPTVTFTNTNDYATAIVFSLAVVLLYWGYHYTSQRKNLWIPLVAVPVCFFLVYMTTSRLAVICMWIILAGLAAFFFLQAKSHRWIPVFFLVIYLAVAFVSDFRYIKTASEKFADDIEDYIEYRSAVAEVGEGALEKVPFPKFKIIRPGINLSDELFNVDEFGNRVFDDRYSGGVRLRLLKHSFACFFDSFGLGVGLGNTEQLAKLNKVAAGGNIWAIHCFVARIIGDLGIFSLLPLALIILKLLAMLVKALRFHIKARNKCGIALLLLVFSSTIIYPFMSTASSDAQDSLAMWLYLGLLVLFAVHLQAGKPEE